MTPQAFIAHWQNNKITERAGAQQHFNDLCDLLEQDKPRDAENYTFERGAKIQGGQGWADVWKRGYFAWEYKAPGKDLVAALKQLMNYALALDNPPLLVVSDLRTIEIHTHFTGHPSEVHRIQVEDLTKPEVRQKLTWLFEDPERFKPQRTTYAVTEQAATRIGEIAQRLNQRGNSPEDVAHFLIQSVFCMFAEDAKLLPEKLFETVLDKSNPDGSKAKKRLNELFNAMQGGGDFAMNDIPWFNGGLFKTIKVPELETVDVINLLDAARMDWSQIEPAILGTLFERGLNPDMRSQLGAHYTDPATIIKIIKPVVEQPLLAEWQMVKAKIEKLSLSMKLVGSAKSNRPNKEMAEGYKLFRDFLERLRKFKVLDPACGSGNFLYLALKSLKDLEHRVNLEVEALGLHRELHIETSPLNVMGIELNPYAAELARVTVWIGEIQWMLAHGYQYRKDPILATLDHIENRDAIITVDGTEAEWPLCDAIVGNPPFLGGARKRRELGDAYFTTLSTVYDGRVADGADLVCYWFDKALRHLQQNKVKYVGLVATNSIRQISNRQVLERIVDNSQIYEAWSDEPWINAGAVVRVSLVCFGSNANSTLDGIIVPKIYGDLRSGDDLTSANPLAENVNVSFFGLALAGKFTVDQDLAEVWLSLPNPNGRPNSDVLRPLWNGTDLTGRWNGRWVIDFGTTRGEAEAMLYEAPFAYVLEHVKPVRVLNNRSSRAEKWWKHGEARPAMRTAIAGLGRYIATSEKSKHRFFVWLSESVAPDNRLIVVARNDDVTFGILSSRFHVCWALAVGSTLEDRPAYATTTCFDMFPFPPGLTLRDDLSLSANSAAIAAAAVRLNELRETWLNPAEWVDLLRTPQEASAGYPLRPTAKPGHEVELNSRTLTNLYNQRPTWLDNSHKTLDKAVAEAYGWSDYTPEMPDDEILRRLLKLNLERSS